MLEADRPVHRRGQLVDRGDALLGVDEQPLPVERDHLTTSGLVPAGTARWASMRSSGRYGSSVWVLIQVIAPSAMMISSGAPQITSSSWVEWSQSGV
jgi:hypothetical protein